MLRYSALFCMLIHTCLAAQSPTNGIMTGSVNYQRSPYGFISELPLAPAQTVGSYHLNSDWLRGNIVLTDQLIIEDVLFMYNMKTHSLEIQHANEIKILDGGNVESYEWVNNYSPLDGMYLNVTKFDDFENTDNLSGFVRLHTSDSCHVLSHYEITFTKASYNAALDVGRREHRINMNERFYLAYNKKFLKVSPSANRFVKDVQSTFGKDIRQFVKERKISTKDVQDLILIAKIISKS